MEHVPDGQEDDERDDLTLLAASGGGDLRAFDAFVVRHQAAVFRFAGALARDVDEAEEVLQGTFIAAWRSAGSFRGSGSARSWLFTIARNHHRRSYRLRAGQPESMHPLSELGLEAGWGADQPLATRIANREWVERGLLRLPESDRQLLVLVDVEGLTAEEAGQVLDTTTSALKSRLHRARLKLVAALRKEDSDG
ncbi:MAG: RNA polymerase sigma factor [Deltaproteobacteria bacterium]|nr:RNA polymerase sigma factor [Deltaproteobacteria bacterium]